jgi:pyruvate dehydrogenase E2 component (dihydrolipoamide acetyltransferase)
MPRDFKLPDLGEGLSEAVLVDWKVKEGDVIKPEQELAEVETDKALTPLPSPIGGKISKLHYKPGDTVPVGAVIVTFDGTDSGDGRQAARKSDIPKKTAAPAQPRIVQPERTVAASTSPPAERGKTQPSEPRPVLAAPATRQLARDRGIDIHLIHGTGPGGRVTQEDVLAFAAGGRREAVGPPGEQILEPLPHVESPTTITRPMLPDFSQFGSVERQPATAIRKRIAQRMTLSSQITAAVTHMDEADVTILEENRHQAQKRAEEKGVKLSLLPYVIKAVASALQRHPIFNSSYDDDKQEIVYKKYIHIGIAVDSPQGLLVPVLRDADRKTLAELARDVVQLADAARAGKLTVDQMRGGSFTITNIGSIGGTAFTPIINWPEIAILGTGRIQERPALKDGVLVVRKKLTVALTFDHRVADGAQAARFVNDIVQYLENPLLLLLEN